jgi:tetratricopeptide (TPR) repeat protein
MPTTDITPAVESARAAAGGDPESFHTGGPLPLNSKTYVQADADREIFEALSAGEYCYVLTTRQIGKSSLMIRTAAKLRESGAAVVMIDLTKFGKNVTLEQWYRGLADRIAGDLGIREAVRAYWSRSVEIAPMQRWLAVIQEIALPALNGRPLFIFIDEVEFSLVVPFDAGELFIGIRECYNRRTQDPALNSLTFCLLGSAHPGDLVKDVRITPFNIGRRIVLCDFTPHEAAPLARGLRSDPRQAAFLLERILWWTGGHPYLTQLFCRAVAGDANVITYKDVDAVCERLFLSHDARNTEYNMVFVRNRILRTEQDLAGVLELYKRVLRGDPVKSEDNNPLIGVLNLSGITRLVNQCLTVRNRIYRTVFDAKWVRANMPEQEKRRQRAAFRSGAFRAAGLGAVGVAIVAVLAGLALRAQRRTHEVLAVSHKANSQMMQASEFIGVTTATQQLIVAPALERLKDLHEKAGKDPDLLRGVAEAYDSVGRVQLKMLNADIVKLDDSRQSFLTALSVRQDVAAETHLPEDDLALAISFQNLGELYSLAQRDGEEKGDGSASTARDWFEKAMEVRKKFNDTHARENRYVVPEAWTLYWLGRNAAERAAIASVDQSERARLQTEAKGFFERAENGVANLATDLRNWHGSGDVSGECPETVRAAAWAAIGDLSTTPVAAAADYYQRAVGQAKSLTAKYKELSAASSAAARSDARVVVQLGFDAADKVLRLADFQFEAGQFKFAQANFRDAIQILDEVRELTPVNVDVRSRLADAHAGLARIAASKAQTDEALRESEAAVREMTTAQQLNPLAGQTRIALARAQIRLGQACLRAKGVRDAAESFLQAVRLPGSSEGELTLADAHVWLGDARQSLGFLAVEALAEPRQPSASRPAYDPEKHPSAQAEYVEALWLCESGKLQGRDVWRVHDLRARARSGLASLYAAKRQFSYADEEFNKADDQFRRADERYTTYLAELAPLRPTLEQRDIRLRRQLDRADNMARQAAVLANFNRNRAVETCETANQMLAETVADLLANPPDPSTNESDAALTERASVVYMNLARGWEQAGEWVQVRSTARKADGLSDLFGKDVSLVRQSINISSHCLRAEAGFRLAERAPDAEKMERFQEVANSYDVLTVTYRPGRVDSGNVSSSDDWPRVARYSGLAYQRLAELQLAKQQQSDAAGSRTQAVRLLNNALDFRKFGIKRNGENPALSAGIVESVRDLDSLLGDDPNETSHVQNIYRDAISTLVLLAASYSPDPAPPHLLNAAGQLYIRQPGSLPNDVLRSVLPLGKGRPGAK